MKMEIILTGDGSHTVFIPEMDVTCHSRHGAIRESRHVFIQEGFRFYHTTANGGNPVSILEIGLGTGLNAFLTLLDAREKKVTVSYTAIEAFPINQITEQLNYPDLLGGAGEFRAIHDAGWESENRITDYFAIFKIQARLQDWLDDIGTRGEIPFFHIIYFDAFAPAAQPELWTEKIFGGLFRITVPGGILVTYSSKGDVQRALRRAGFLVSKIPGPPGKREIIRALKPSSGSV